jgi:DNA-directed RNA polymerase specialized sigma24 family protein
VVYSQSHDELEKQYARLLNKYSSWNIPYMDREDIKQELRAVLFKANNQFDPTKNTKFLTYLYTAFSNTVKKLSYKSAGQNTYTPMLPISLELQEEAYEIPDKDNMDSDLFSIVGLASPKTQMLAQLIVAGYQQGEWVNFMDKREIHTAVNELGNLLRKEK